jgi:hypothetical protein
MAELFENAHERGAQIPRRLDPEERAAGRLAEIAQERRVFLGARRHGIDNGVGAPARVQHRVGRQPARGVDAVAEDNQQRPADIRFGEHHRGIGAVDQRRLAGGFRIVQGCLHRGNVFRES